MANNLASFLRGLSIGANEEYDAVQDARTKTDAEKARQVAQYDLEVYKQSQENSRADKNNANQLEIAKLRQDEQTAAERKQRRMWLSFTIENAKPEDRAALIEKYGAELGIEMPTAASKSSTVQDVSGGTSEETQNLVKEIDPNAEAVASGDVVTRKVPKDVPAGVIGEDFAPKELPATTEAEVAPQSASQAFSTPLTDSLKAYQELLKKQNFTKDVNITAGEIPTALAKDEEISKTQIQAAEATEKLQDKVYKDSAGQNPMDLFKSNIPTTEELMSGGKEMPLFYNPVLIGQNPPTTANYANTPEYTKQRAKISQTIGMLSTAAMNANKNLDTSADEILQDAININMLMNSGKVISTGKIQQGLQEVAVSVDPSKTQEIRDQLAEILAKYGLDTSALTTVFPPVKQTIQP